MKKIYLVKKDVNKPAGDGNWITMTPYEFAQFMKTPEGHDRRKNFAQIDACDCDDYIIVAEGEDRLVKEIRAERDVRIRLNQYRKECGYTEFSYNEQESSEEDLSGEELIEDCDINIEEEVINKTQKELLQKALATLKPEELTLINDLFFAEEPLSVQKYAELCGEPQSTINYRKLAILKKLKKFF